MNSLNTALFIVCCLAARGIEGNLIDELRESVKCLTDSGVDSESISNLQHGTVNSDFKTKDYLFCMNRVAGIQDGAGYLNNANVEKMLKRGQYNKDTIRDIQEVCAIQKESPQETAYHFMKCFYDGTLMRKFF